MVNRVAARVLDLGLNVLDTEAESIYVCSADPADFTEATTTLALGNKTFAIGGAFGVPADAAPNGRKVSSTVVTDGTITDDGEATHIAVVDTANSRLLAVTTLAADQMVTDGNTFTLTSFDISLPSQ